MASVQITADGSSSPVSVGVGHHFITLVGDFGGGTVKLEVDIGRGYVPHKEYEDGLRAQIGFTSNDMIILLGPCNIRAVTTGSTSPNVTIYSDPIPKIV